MPKIKLTDAAVQKLKAPKGGRAEFFDVTLPGFALRVSGATERNPEGRRSWCLFYRFGGEQRRITFDPPYPALGLADARRRAGDALQLLAAGKDPIAEKADLKRNAARKPDTVAAAVDLFIKRHLEAKKRAPRYITETRRNFDNHVLPRWGERDIKTISRRDVIELLDAVMDAGTQVRREDGKKHHIPGGPISANRTLAAVRALFNWALRRGIIDSTPAALVERPGAETRRERTLAADEIRAVWQGAEKMGGAAGAFFRTAMLLGQRRDETARMRWGDLDLEAGIWSIPADMTKAGRAHMVPLPPAAIDVLRHIPRKMAEAPDGTLSPSPHVFTVGGRSPISGFTALKRRLDKKVSEIRGTADQDGLEPWTIHDLRRTAATEMARLGVPRLTISKLLNHADRTVTAIYDRHDYLTEKRDGLARWAGYVEGLNKPAVANVVEMRRVS